MASAGRFTVGSHVWVEDADVAWIDGLVEDVYGDELFIKCSSGKKVTANASSVYPRDVEVTHCGVEDITRLAYLHEPGVLRNLKSRYGMNEIYTYTGNILIAVNPFQRLPHLYNDHMMAMYKGAEFGELSPHPFAMADRAYRLMKNSGISQAILVSGESGAGKTESTKKLMQYLAFMGGNFEYCGRSVHQQLLGSNTLLEAFGNAKTVRNKNSSRFVKFVELQFDRVGRISGAAIRTYLLERSRICQISDQERNYHCFYMLCAAPLEDRERYKVGDAASFHYLNQSNCINIDGMDDSSEYVATRRAMDIVGIRSDDQDAIFRVVAAILHLGNVEFSEGNEIDSSVPKDDKSKFHLRTSAELFMCEEKSLEESLCTRVIVTRDGSIVRNLDLREAALSRDAVARIVYSRLFDWIVENINISIGQDPNSKGFISFVDICGFESFKTNSFEQFCINLADEKLQQHFIQHVFKMEQEEYTKEEIDWSYIQFVDNQEILDLIEKKPGGIISLLDETCMFPKSTHEIFAEKLYKKYKDNPHFSRPKFSRSDFTIHHYAGNVTYQTDLFLDKNRNATNEHQDLLHASRCSFVSSLFPPEESTESTKFTSIGSTFKQQLQGLLETLSETEPHYMRCIKPNNVLKPASFDNRYVLQQLRCGGVLEAIRISCLGYPTRRTFEEFVDRFGVLLPELLDEGYDEVNATKMFLEKVNLTGYQIGKTKVFLRAGQMAELDAQRTEVLSRSDSTIQRKFLSFLARRNFIQLQAMCRGQIARHYYEDLLKKAASLKIPTCYRMHFSREHYKDLCSACTTVQSGLRGMAARSELHSRQQTKAALIIQSFFRSDLASSRYMGLRKAAITAQCAWRGRVARKELRKLKMAAKESGDLQAANNKLEKQVEELTWRLHLEKRMRTDMEEAKTRENKKLQQQLQELQYQCVRHKMAMSRVLLLRFDKAQEDRNLTDAEVWLHKQIKITYLGLASLERTIARQRARIAVLKDGDANTSFFHRQSTYRRQKNRMHSITVQDQIFTDQQDMAEAAFHHFDSLLGTEVPRDCTLDLGHLIEPEADLGELDLPFDTDEIWNAVKHMPARKAPGPDGFTSEFLRACWSIVKQDFTAVFQQLFELRGRGFCKLNQALLILLPKKPDASQLGDYRPISLIHLVAKIFAKLLSLRLGLKLPDMVSPVQNAFIKGRTLHDNFTLVRQSARLLHQLGAPRILLKLDLAKAFDSISWPFLIEVLRQYGFSDRFIGWIAILLSSASTRILINGEPGPPIWHRRGLRQGDPLSPQLFVLSVDVLGRLISRGIQVGILQQLHPRRTIPSISLYADDVILFCHASAGDVEAVKATLHLFGQASGLRVNYAKSSATLIRCEADIAAPLVQSLGCQFAEWPITYLGIPLSLRRLTTAQLQPLIEKMARKLPTWKSKLMQKPGRLALVKSVLSAITVHQLLALAPTKKAIKQMEKIERGFLWEGRAAANGGSCHVNWKLVCRPTSHGGLGIQDLDRMGMALRLRWQWLSRTDPNRAWSGLDLQFSGEERDFFFASTFMALGDGLTALFWEDRWINGRSVKEVAPQLYSCIPKRRRKMRTVADGLTEHNWAQDIHGVLGIQEIAQYLSLWRQLERATLSDEADRLTWKWTANGHYSAKSAYLASFHGSTNCRAWKLIWKTWAPPKVKFFHWLANLDRCWTADRLARRGLQHHPKCLLCDQMPETMHHLMLVCPFSRQTWHEILSWLRMAYPAPNDETSLFDWWCAARQNTPKQMHKGLASATLLIPWMLWKHRNACVFEGARPSVSDLVHKIKDEAAAWVSAGANGLRDVIPQTWDVH